MSPYLVNTEARGYKFVAILRPQDKMVSAVIMLIKVLDTLLHETVTLNTH